MAGKGRPKTGGRQKGATNRATKEIKDMIRGALEDAGGQKYLAGQAKENPVAFMGLVGRILPKDVKIEGEIRHTLEQIIAGSE